LQLIQKSNLAVREKIEIGETLWEEWGSNSKLTIYLLYDMHF